MNLKNSSAKIKIPKFLVNKLKNKKIEQIYKKFERSLKVNENFAVAVSGGPDSMALAFLAKVYSIKNEIVPKFFIVDHNLRPESGKEAKLVKKVLKQFSINSEILKWRGKKPSKNIQSLARKKRYELLSNRCEKLKINNILLGHHQDDLFENFFIRLLRGSGLKGLISLEMKSKINDKNLLRPLLDQKKNDLEFISKFVFDFYVKDPSNENEKYQRIKIRKLIKELKTSGLDEKKFFKTIKNLKDANSVVNFYVNENLIENTYFTIHSNKLIINEKFFRQPHEIVFRSFSDSIKLIGKKHYPVRGKKLDKIIHDIKRNELFRVTIGNCIIEKVNQSIIITKEH